MTNNIFLNILTHLAAFALGGLIASIDIQRKIHKYFKSLDDRGDVI